jgi:hypothetical protein
MRKFPIIMWNLEKCPECLQRFHVGYYYKFLREESKDKKEWLTFRPRIRLGMCILQYDSE